VEEAGEEKMVVATSNLSFLRTPVEEKARNVRTMDHHGTMEPRNDVKHC
jgi:hypothetical protein